MPTRKDFYAYTASAMGSYELLAIATGRTRFPTVSTFCARRRYRRVLLVAWVLGLAVHIARHTVDD